MSKPWYTKWLEKESSWAYGNTLANLTDPGIPSEQPSKEERGELM